jgi:hypothetical protein
MKKLKIKKEEYETEQDKIISKEEKRAIKILREMKYQPLKQMSFCVYLTERNPKTLKIFQILLQNTRLQKHKIRRMFKVKKGKREYPLPPSTLKQMITKMNKEAGFELVQEEKGTNKNEVSLKINPIDLMWIGLTKRQKFFYQSTIEIEKIENCIKGISYMFQSKGLETDPVRMFRIFEMINTIKLSSVELLPTKNSNNQSTSIQHRTHRTNH